MALRQRIVSEIYDERNNEIVDRQIIQDKAIKKPEKIEELGYNHKEQISMLQLIQDTFLNEQQKTLILKECNICGSRVSKAGRVPSDFHSIYTVTNLYKLADACDPDRCGMRGCLPA